MANATLFRYKTETFVENNPELYNSLMFMVDTYNNAALSKDIAIALGSAAVWNLAVPMNNKLIIERFLRNELALNTFYLNAKNSKFLAYLTEISEKDLILGLISLPEFII